MINLKDILSEFTLKSFPDWNEVQLEVFRKLKKQYNLETDDIIRLGKVLRDHMNKKYFSGEWNVNKSEDELFDELISLSKKSINS